ncbi:hypothetical protein EBR03_08590 [bacterium]|nr:hypothetical protein [bacterium]
MKKQNTKRDIKAILKKNELLDKVELSGIGQEWEIQTSDEPTKELVSKALRDNSVAWGGYKCGFGGWIMQSENQYSDRGEWSNPSSKWHY